MNRQWLSLSFAILVFGAGCRPRTPSERARDTVRDAGHDLGKSIENATK